MPAPKPQYFRIIYYDDDARTTNVSGVVSDDGAVSERTSDLQLKGRNVRISTTGPVSDAASVPTPDSQIMDGYAVDPDLHW